MSIKPLRAVQAVVLSLDLVETQTTDHHSFSISISLPGRDDEMVKSWRASRGLLTADQMSDMVTWVGLQLADAVFTWGGTARGSDAG